MKKKLLLFKILACLLFIFMFALSGCDFTINSGSETPATYTITFVQDGQKDIVFQVKKGGNLTDIPTPVDIEGYEVSWSITDFSNIREDLIVTIMRIPKMFKITYTMGILENNNGVVIRDRTQTVEYNATYATYTPTCEGYEFLGWKMAGEDNFITGGTYLYTEDISLVAVWELANDELGWSELH